LLDRLQFPAEDRDRVAAAVVAVPRLLDELSPSASAGALSEAARGVPVEGIALAGALGSEQAARRWLGELRQMRLNITGDDLIAAGVPSGPEIGRLLRETLTRRLEGELDDDRERQLQAALGLR